MSDEEKYPGRSRHVILRVPQQDGSERYELYYEPVRYEVGRLVVFVGAGDREWALRMARMYNIPEQDVRIEPRDDG